MAYKSTIYIVINEDQVEAFKHLLEFHGITYLEQQNNPTRFIGNDIRWYDNNYIVSAINKFCEHNGTLIDVGEDGAFTEIGNTEHIYADVQIKGW